MPRKRKRKPESPFFDRLFRDDDDVRDFNRPGYVQPARRHTPRRPTKEEVRAWLETRKRAD